MPIFIVILKVAVLNRFIPFLEKILCWFCYEELFYEGFWVEFYMYYTFFSLLSNFTSCKSKWRPYEFAEFWILLYFFARLLFHDYIFMTISKFSSPYISIFQIWSLTIDNGAHRFNRINEYDKTEQCTFWKAWKVLSTSR